MDAVGPDSDGGTARPYRHGRGPSPPRPRRGSAAAVVVAPSNGRPSASPRPPVFLWMVGGPSWGGGGGGGGGGDDAVLLSPFVSGLWCGMRRLGQRSPPRSVAVRLVQVGLFSVSDLRWRVRSQPASGFCSRVVRDKTCARKVTLEDWSRKCAHGSLLKRSHARSLANLKTNPTYAYQNYGRVTTPGLDGPRQAPCPRREGDCVR